MNEDLLLEATMRTRLDTVPVPSIGATDIMREAKRTHRQQVTRRTALIGGALVGSAAVAMVIRTRPLAPEPAAGADALVASGEWDEITPPPFSFGGNPMVAWTGSEILVLGGPGRPCLGGFYCPDPPPYETDGVAYDVATRAWRTLPQAPTRLDFDASWVYAAGHLVISSADTFRAYVPSTDEWIDVPGLNGPPATWGSLTAIGSQVYALGYQFDEDFALPKEVPIARLSLDSRSWDVLTPVDIGFPRSITATPFGPVAFAREYGIGDGIRRHRASILQGGTWRSLGAGPSARDSVWHWTDAGRLVALDAGNLTLADDVPTLSSTLDVATASWGQTPPMPEPTTAQQRIPRQFAAASAVSGSRFALQGQLYLDDTQSWRRLPVPPDLTDVGLALPRQVRDGVSAVSMAWVDDRLFYMRTEMVLIADVATYQARAWLQRSPSEAGSP